MALNNTFNGVIKKITTSFKWVISMDDLKNLEIDKKVLSPHHITFDDVQTTWQLSINKKLYAEKYYYYMSITLLQGNVHNTICSISLMNNDEVMENVFSVEHSFKDNKSLEKYIAPLSNIDIKFLSNNKLTFFCRIILSEENNNKENEENEENKENENWFSQYNDIFNDKTSSDLTVKVVKKFYLHKNILSACSPVLASMLQDKAHENNQNELQLELDDEVSPGYVKNFFYYMYSNNVDLNDYDESRDLLVLADKYDVKDLKSYCEKDLSLHMDKSEAVETLIFAIIGNSQLLKKSTMKYISKRLDFFMNKPNFKTFAKENPDLFYEIVKMNLDI